MKLKYSLLYALLAVAFAGACVWVFLSGGKSAKAIRAKFRLGGLMLTASSFLAASCGGCSPTVTCYDTEVMCYDMPAQIVEFTLPEGSDGVLSAGDVVAVNIRCCEFKYLNYRVYSIVEGQEPGLLWEGAIGEDRIIPIKEVAYKGKIEIDIYGSDESADSFENVIGCSYFTLK
ncbi:MAG: hypothetical protein MJY67_08590 [Bacteroidales bacterium]|nr:hypothetical protein [Bacteroidales bacterium]